METYGTILLLAPALVAVCALVLACGRNWTQRAVLLVFLALVIAGGVLVYQEERADREAADCLLPSRADDPACNEIRGRQ